MQIIYKILGGIGLLAALSFCRFERKITYSGVDTLKAGFLHPPASARPGVYWYFMDGWMSEKGIRDDLESMKKAGIGRVIFLEVNVGVPRGPIDFLSDQWLQLFRYAVKEAQRLDIEITLGIGPGWSGSGGPWVPMDESMQSLVSGTVTVRGPSVTPIKLPLPQPKKPYFGGSHFTPEMKKQWEDFYKNVAVLAFPTPAIDKRLKDIDEAALYYRAPYSSRKGVKPFLPSLSHYPDFPKADISKGQVLDLTDKLQPDGILNWKVPEGNWTIMRFVSRNSGAITRPAPAPGLGFESDKMNPAALKHHLDAYVGKILQTLGPLNIDSPGGLKFLHMDSWEMGAQNWTPAFRKEFTERRGYDPLPFYPVYAGYIVGNTEMSKRFLWDLRQTCQELILQYHAEQVKKYAHAHGLDLSIEPYDMNPTADLNLGSIADIPMCEFWSKGYGFNTSFSCIEAASIAHINGIPVVQAEAFTANRNEGWKQYPGSMKNQGDWAFAAGINRFYYHTFQHKPLADSLYPGMTMGPYGVHWDRKQTWWPMVSYYHRYISRCQFMLQRGKPVADVLYLTPEGAPQIFLPPPSALTGDPFLPDRKGYNFDGCSPKQLYQANVKNHEIVFPSGASYHLLVLPAFKTMTPALLKKISSLVYAGAIVVGSPTLKSPSLSGYPECDQKVRSMAIKLWGSLAPPKIQTVRDFGKGKIIWGGNIGIKNGNILYPDYDMTAAILNKMGMIEDFKTMAPIRYTHRRTNDRDIYFVSNRTGRRVKADCVFRTDKGVPRLWNPLTGKIRMLPEFYVNDKGATTVPLQFEAFQSFFIVFERNDNSTLPTGKNFPAITSTATLQGPWTVSFDPKWGGPEKIVFDSLTDWASSSEKGIKYYSGIAVYRKKFDWPTANDTGKNTRVYLDLGQVKDMAHVWLNGEDLGVVWTAPWRVDVTGVVKQKNNHLKVSVANLWPNRLIGDDHLPYDGIKDGEFPDWLLKGQKRVSGRYTFTTYDPYNKKNPLLKSGLLGPVTIQKEKYQTNLK